LFNDVAAIIDMIVVLTRYFIIS